MSLRWFPRPLARVIFLGAYCSRIRAPNGVSCMSRKCHFMPSSTGLVLSLNGVVDPLSIEDAIAFGAYASLEEVLSWEPDRVIDTIERAGLRGRGGGGFPTGVKWRFARSASGDRKFIICNADEGDPGAFMDRSILEGNPHSVIEGMIVGAYAIGAGQGYIYCRGGVPAGSGTCSDRY